MTQKFTINLLQAELLPKEATVSLARMVILWGVLLFAMLLWGALSHYQAQNNAEQAKSLKAANNNLSNKLEELKKVITQKRTDSALLARLDTLKLVMNNKKSLLIKLTDPSRTYVAGFSNSMTELSQYHHKNISLEKVVIAQDDIVFSGLAKNPDAVPQWLSSFEQSNLLSGKRFKHFSIRENDKKITEFTIGSSTTSEHYNDVKKEGAE
jgi:Tfp pilus assembly protein PilN